MTSSDTIVTPRDHYVHLSNGTVWPNPDATNDREWRMRYAGEITQQDRMFAASVLAAYRVLVNSQAKAREEYVDGIRAHLPDTDDDRA